MLVLEKEKLEQKNNTKLDYLKLSHIQKKLLLTLEYGVSPYELEHRLDLNRVELIKVTKELYDFFNASTRRECIIAAHKNNFIKSNVYKILPECQIATKPKNGKGKYTLEENHKFTDIKLSPQETDILLYISFGYKAKEICALSQFNFNCGTLRTYLNNIYTKLGVQNKYQAVVACTIQGLI